MIDGTHTTDAGWTFTAHRNDGKQTYRVSWRSPEGKRGIIHDRMTVEMIEQFDPDADWQRGINELLARKTA